MTFAAVAPAADRPGAPRRSDLAEGRQAIAQRLYRDSSFGAFDAMAQMGALTVAHIESRVRPEHRAKVWLGGSLGRREMLPNSDVDLFVFDDPASEVADVVTVEGVDRFERGCMPIASVRRLVAQGSIDANPLIDGRALAEGEPGDAVAAAIRATNTTQRQYANLISEYFYYRYFDFPWKTTDWGPNLKYSSGSSRTTLLLNFVHRIATHQFPAWRATTPELAAALAYLEQDRGRRTPRRAIDLILVAKNAAITSWYRTGDPSVRHVSRRTLGLIFEVARDRWDQLGLTSPARFADAYTTARAALEACVEQSVNACLLLHPRVAELRAITAMDPAELRDSCLHSAIGSPTDELFLVSFTAWRLSTTTSSPQDMAQLAATLATRPLSRVWGGVMAVACSPATDDTTMEFLTEWLADAEEGAYLTKLVSRNPSAGPATRAGALHSYQAKENVVVT
ncbi:nucleotidyltransferase domain-containing protein [Blastococcus capsensis]|uniref:nucleotidyltransferase domain-containing protein n=1 Tax=Blastococcus capsensis TaxID=1564163 RepID=UPI002540A9CB|nr:nucleotidyltransferase domain-containing protein [Blastococcus capsensis]MDK3257014.1 nucleotidyltransferase domain-containing protein [Blastococcus capsensis]